MFEHVFDTSGTQLNMVHYVTLFQGRHKPTSTETINVNRSIDKYYGTHKLSMRRKKIGKRL